VSGCLKKTAKQRTKLEELQRIQPPKEQQEAKEKELKKRLTEVQQSLGPAKPARGRKSTGSPPPGQAPGTALHTVPAPRLWLISVPAWSTVVQKLVSNGIPNGPLASGSGWLLRLGPLLPPPCCLHPG
jgi:hypothetical protein